MVQGGTSFSKQTYQEQRISAEAIRQLIWPRKIKRKFFGCSRGDWYDVGEMNLPCNFRESLQFATEGVKFSFHNRMRFSTCCNIGALSLPPLEQPPAILSILLTKQLSRTEQYRENIWFYNSMLSIEVVTANLMAERPCSATFNQVDDVSQLHLPLDRENFAFL